MSLLINGMDMPRHMTMRDYTLRARQDGTAELIDKAIGKSYDVIDVPSPLDPHDDNVGAVLECAVRYALGRKTYMVSVVTELILSVVTELNNRTLLSIGKEIVKHERFFDKADRKEWSKLRDALRKEIAKRNLARWE